MAFDVVYSAGGKVDKVGAIDKIKLIDALTKVERLDLVKEIEKLDIVSEVDVINLLKQVDLVSTVNQVNRIKGFATKTQPYNTMRMYDIPALKGNYEFFMDLPNVEIELLALSVTCSGYGEEDHYDLFFNDKKWFEDWYCSEVKEGLFIGSSTYVYAAPSSSKIKLIFKNTSGTSKKVWLGVRTLID